MNGRQIAAAARRTGREVRDLVLALVALAFFGVTLVVPQRAVVWVGGFLARMAGLCIRRLNRIGLRNLALAFPEMPEDQRRAILSRSWDNMGRTAVEYFYMDRIWDFDPAASEPGRIEILGGGRFVSLAGDGLPAIILSAHLANWELPMVAAVHHGLDATALFARPRNRWIARMVIARRKSIMGDLVMSGPGAAHRLARVLAAGSHLGLLVDQFYDRGPKVMLFGHPTLANPIFARLARQIECPVHTVRVVRLPGDRFRVELGEALDLPREAGGRIDVAASAQVVANIIEGWVREHPDQWLWVHRRWR